MKSTASLRASRLALLALAFGFFALLPAAETPEGKMMAERKMTAGCQALITEKKAMMAAMIASDCPMMQAMPAMDHSSLPAKSEKMMPKTDTDR